MKKLSFKGRAIISIFIIIGLVAAFNEFSKGFLNSSFSIKSQSKAEQKVKNHAEKIGVKYSKYPDSLIELMERNPETESFVLNYPTKKDAPPNIDLSKYKNAKSVPMLLQWDERWGYSEYAGELFAISGCAPVCLSMVSIYLLGNTDYHPKYIAEFSEANGYSVVGSGSSWSLISEGGTRLGLNVTEIPLDKNRIIKNLEAGNPIICVMGPGDFTTTGHFIVMTGYENGKIKVNDPNSIARSKALWEYEDIQGQIKNLWVCRKGKTNGNVAKASGKRKSS